MTISVAWGQSPVIGPPGDPTVEEPHWLSKDEQVAMIDTLHVPPAPGTPEDAADLRTEIDIQNARAPERSRQAIIDAGNPAELIVNDFDPRITPSSNPRFYRFFALVHRQADQVDVAAKDRWKRPRPFVEHADLVHPLFTAGGFSYPSGHSTAAFCDALILETIFPDRADVIARDAERIAQSRVVAGVHYETDVREGELLGKEVARELLTKPEFLNALEEARAEIARSQ